MGTARTGPTARVAAIPNRGLPYRHGRASGLLLGSLARGAARQIREGSRTERLVRRHFWSAVLTDIQFWVPVIVLALGTGLLLSLR